MFITLEIIFSGSWNISRPQVEVELPILSMQSHLYVLLKLMRNLEFVDHVILCAMHDSPLLYTVHQRYLGLYSTLTLHKIYQMECRLSKLFAFNNMFY